MSVTILSSLALLLALLALLVALASRRHADSSRRDRRELLARLRAFIRTRHPTG